MARSGAPVAVADSQLNDLDVDIAIVGAGVAGTSAASALAQDGLSVALIDFRASHPPDFRAERIVERQVGFFESFGLGEAAHRQLTPFEGVWVHRFGRFVEKTRKREYSSPYADLVNALHDALPPAVQRLVGRVLEVRAGEDTQVVELSDGRTVTARLLIVATGLGDSIRGKLGIGRIVRSRAHSLVGGFDLANPATDFPFPSLVWVTERPADKAAYLSVFPMGDHVRANLFTYRTANEPWVMQFRRDPTATFQEFFPRLTAMFAPMVVDGPVQFRPTDIAVAHDHRRPGVVLIGDAFFTTCPVSGTGMDKALNDVDRLRRLVPRWLATPGMSADKIGQFYDDPVKREIDAASLEHSLRERAIRMDHGLTGSIMRLRRNVLRRGAYRARALVGALHAASR